MTSGGAISMIVGETNTAAGKFSLAKMAAILLAAEGAMEDSQGGNGI